MRPKKFDYDSDDFYDEILALSMQGLTDAEIADALSDKFGQSLDPCTFYSMKNGNYRGWNADENARRSVRLCKVLARGRRKIVSVIRGAYLKAAIGGKRTKNIHTTRRRIRMADGTLTDNEEIQTVESEIEMPPNVQALATLLYHHDEEWRRVEKGEEGVIPDEIEHGIDIEKWINDQLK